MLCAVCPMDCGGREPKVYVGYTEVCGGSPGDPSSILPAVPYFSTGENSSGVHVIGIFKPYISPATPCQPEMHAFPLLVLCNPKLPVFKAPVIALIHHPSSTLVVNEILICPTVIPELLQVVGVSFSSLIIPDKNTRISNIPG